MTSVAVELVVEMEVTVTEADVVTEEDDEHDKALLVRLLLWSLLLLEVTAFPVADSGVEVDIVRLATPFTKAVPKP